MYNPKLEIEQTFKFNEIILTTKGIPVADVDDYNAYQVFFGIGDVIGYVQPNAALQGILKATLPFYEYDSGTSTYIPVAPVGDICLRLCRRFWDAVAYVGNEYTTEVEATEKVCVRMLNKLEMTWEKYSTLYNLYAGNLARILAGSQISVSTQSVGKFKDTPEANIDPTSDGYNTNVTTTTTTTTSEDSRDTVVARLREVREKIDDIMDLWTDEFKDLFVYENNI